MECKKNVELYTGKDISKKRMILALLGVMGERSNSRYISSQLQRERKIMNQSDDNQLKLIVLY